MIAGCSTCIKETANGICVGWTTNILCVGLVYGGIMLMIIGGLWLYSRRFKTS